ncbi:hypothetical protein R6V09_18930 [Streptomyces sp. W16]|uniref:hypothetical protein n=1 Tax=Streptomyces sp. W16 TaxID=3076631 RepID=UPI00295B6E8F|nr:hypothetical protein [Streptomyces sp. W16]MDV9172177.1 hypothetical protein [Streptomyces sp. W16]
MAVEGVRPELILDEDPWQSGLGRGGYAHVRVWRVEVGQVVVVLSGRGAEYHPETLLPLLRAEYPDDTVEFFFHRPMDWTALGYYAELTSNDDGTVTVTHIAGDALAARLGPSLYATEDPDDHSAGYGGA